MLRDMGLPGVGDLDGRRLEIVATGLPVHRGLPLGVDATLVSPLHATGAPWPRAAEMDGVAIARAERDKRKTYPELLDSCAMRLVTVAAEVGGRMSADSRDLLRQLATARARSAPLLVRAAARHSWFRRWTGMLIVAVQDTLAIYMDPHASHTHQP